MRKQLLNQWKLRRMLSCLFVLMFIPIGTLAQEYNLWVAGVQVTSDNAAAIVGENISGSISFEASTNTLTLDGATVTGTTIGGGCIITEMSELRILLKNENILNCSTDSCTAIRANAAGDQVLTIVKGAEGCSLTIDGNRAIRNFSSLNLTSLAWDGDYSYGNNVVDGKDVNCLYDNYWNEVGEAVLTGYYGIKVGGVFVNSDNEENIFEDEEFATAFYDNATSTLTLRGCHFEGDCSSFITIASDVAELNVRILGYNKVGMAADTLFSSDAACTVNIMTDATLPGKMDYYGDNSTGSNVTLNFGASGLALRGESGNFAIEATEGISDITYFGTGDFHEDDGSPYTDYPSYDYSGIGWFYSNASVTNGNSELPPMVSSSEAEGYVTRIRSTGTDIIKSITFQCVPFGDTSIDVAIVSLDGETTYATGTLTNNNVTLVPDDAVTLDDICLEFSSEGTLFWFVPMAVKVVDINLDISVGGTSVTELNANDVFDDGTVVYDAENRILTLIDADINYSYHAIDVKGDALTIKIQGNSTITSDDGFVVFNDYLSDGTLTFITDESNPGTLTLKNNSEEYSLSLTDMNDLFNAKTVYNNNLNIAYNDGRFVIAAGVTYPIKVVGIQVSSLNSDNIIGDKQKSIRFDNATNTLTLKDFRLTPESLPMDETFVETTIEDLTVNILGSNIIENSSEEPVFLNTNAGDTGVPTLTFTTDADQPGRLTVNAFLLSGGYGASDPTLLNGLGMTVDGTCYVFSVTPTSTYGLFVDGTEVNNVNADNVFEDTGISVSFDYATSTLILDGADILEDVILTSDSPIENLKVMLKGYNQIAGTFQSEKADHSASLTFDINVNNPGSLLFIGKTSVDDIQTGFTFGDTSLLNGLKQGLVNQGNDWEISTFIPITPVVNEDEPTTEEIMYVWDFRSVLLDNTEVNNLLYTLPSGEQFASDEGSYEGGVVIMTGMTDEEVENAVNADYPVGSPEYAEHFWGITLMVPAGEGEVKFKISGQGKILKVKVGNETAYAPVGKPWEQKDNPEVQSVEQPFADEYYEIVIPFSCTEPTYIRLYMLDDEPNASDSRNEVPFRGKVLHGTVKVSNYSATSSMIVNNNMASVYASIGKYANYNPSSGTVSMSTVSMMPSHSRANRDVMNDSRQGSPRKENITNSYPIVELGPHAFDDITDKENLRYIDLSGTMIENMVVNRSSGTMKGIGEHTLICLPENNDDGFEVNVVLGDKCRSLALDENHPFRAPKLDEQTPFTFTAQTATLNRTFTPGQTSTVFLPFEIPVNQANAMGEFHAFKEIQGSKAVFCDAETGDIAANTPFIFIPQTDRLEATEVCIVGTDVTEVASENPNGNFNLIGTYQTVVWDTDQTDIYGFAAISQDDNGVVPGEFVRAAAGASVGPFRAYLQASSAPARLEVVFEDVVTGIESLDDLTVSLSDNCYDLQGRKLSNSKLSDGMIRKGMYIVNGKKVIK